MIYPELHFTGQVWRPPYEANSQLLQITSGCTWHKCKFCSLYHGTPDNALSVKLLGTYSSPLSVIYPHTRFNVDSLAVYFVCWRISCDRKAKSKGVLMGRARNFSISCLRSFISFSDALGLSFAIILNFSQKYTLRPN